MEYVVPIMTFAINPVWENVIKFDKTVIIIFPYLSVSVACQQSNAFRCVINELLEDFGDKLINSK